METVKDNRGLTDQNTLIVRDKKPQVPRTKGKVVVWIKLIISLGNLAYDILQ